MERIEIRLPGPYLRNHDGTNNKKNVKKKKHACWSLCHMPFSNEAKYIREGSRRSRTDCEKKKVVLLSRVKYDWQYGARFASID